MKTSILGAFLSFSISLQWATAHQVVWNKGMYCINGPQTADDENAKNPVNPLWNLTRSDYWMHHVDNCDQFPPADGDFLELPVGQTITLEIATNRAFTTLSYNGTKTSKWTDGQNYPDDYSGNPCITTPNLHTQNQSMTAGSAIAISYQSDITQATPETFSVISVNDTSPWQRLTDYAIPLGLPPCPSGGCHCIWLWIPNGCGEPNIYIFPYICIVIGSTSTKKLAPPQPAKWCEGEPNNCVPGAKQPIIWNQLDGNNIEVDGYDLAGEPKSPGYNMKCGFPPGAQNDIFLDDDTNATTSTDTGGSTSTSASASAPTASSATSSDSTSTNAVPTDSSSASSSESTTVASASGTSTSTSSSGSSTATTESSSTSPKQSRSKHWKRHHNNH